MDIYSKHKIALTRFRCTNHKLAVENQRYIGTLRCERFCKFCLENENINVIEDEIHFLLVCPQYRNLRSKFIDKHLIPNLDKMENFMFIMLSTKYSCVKDLSIYLYEAFKIHG